MGMGALGNGSPPHFRKQNEEEPMAKQKAETQSTAPEKKKHLTPLEQAEKFRQRAMEIELEQRERLAAARKKLQDNLAKVEAALAKLGPAKE